MSENTKKVLKNKKVDSIIIPGGLTGLIQAPDVSWNAPFKTFADYIRVRISFFFS